MALDNHDLRVTITKPRPARHVTKPSLIMPLKTTTTTKQYLKIGRKVIKNFGYPLKKRAKTCKFIVNICKRVGFVAFGNSQVIILDKEAMRTVFWQKKRKVPLSGLQIQQ